MLNPKWHRDEIILALDLYFSTDRGSIDDKNPKIQELSKTLNDLPLFPDRPDEVKFRNANGITLKLANFLHFDPDYEGKGMSGGSKLDKQVFNEFAKDRDKLKAIVSEIRLLAASDKVKGVCNRERRANYQGKPSKSTKLVLEMVESINCI